MLSSLTLSVRILEKLKGRAKGPVTAASKPEVTHSLSLPGAHWERGQNDALEQQERLAHGPLTCGPHRLQWQ